MSATAEDKSNVAEAVEAVQDANPDAAFEPIFPSTTELILDTACCCSFCGFWFEFPACCSCGQKVTELCCTVTGRANCSDFKWTLCSNECQQSICELEWLCGEPWVAVGGTEPEMFACSADNPGKLQRANCMAMRSKGRTCFICDMGGIEKISCCPNSCIKAHQQNCCIDQSCALPCDEEVPCAIACCGVYCYGEEEAKAAKEKRAAAPNVRQPGAQA